MRVRRWVVVAAALVKVLYCLWLQFFKGQDVPVTVEGEEEESGRLITINEHKVLDCWCLALLRMLSWFFHLPSFLNRCIWIWRCEHTDSCVRQFEVISSGRWSWSCRVRSDWCLPKGWSSWWRSAWHSWGCPTAADCAFTAHCHGDFKLFNRQPVVEWTDQWLFVDWLSRWGPELICNSLSC